MPNIEIKAKCSDLLKAKEIAKAYQTEYLGKLHQIDTYYNTKEGRIKLREINNETFQLIPYYKDYTLGPMKSSYALLEVEDPISLKDILNKTLGTLCVIDKEREVFLIDNVRIHLDKVKNLGNFIEFEAVYKYDSEEIKEKEKVSKLMETFNITSNKLLDMSYIDYYLGRDL